MNPALFAWQQQQQVAATGEAGSFDRQKFVDNNYFAYHRRGWDNQIQGPQTRDPWELAIYNPRLRLYAFPYAQWRAPPGPWSNIYKVQTSTVPENAAGGAFAPPESSKLKYRRRDQVRAQRIPTQDTDLSKYQQLLDLQKGFDDARIPIKIVRILGKGGFGVVVLCKGDGTSKKNTLVMKVSLDPADRSFVRERGYMRVLRGSKHIVQSFDWADVATMPAKASSTAAVAFNSNANNTSTDNSWKSDRVIIMEYLGGGDLSDFIKELRTTGEVPDFKHLWQIFCCLIRAAVAMKYPKGVDPANPDEADETVPAMGSEDWNNPYDLIHFDLKPPNVFIGDVSDPQHTVTPVVKIGDFGISRRAPEANQYPNEYRRRGTPWWYFPEQFHKEWDFIDTYPALNDPLPQVAGILGSHNNIYIIGGMIREIMTQTYPFRGPNAQGPLNDPRGRAVLDIQPENYIQDFDGMPVNPFHTHAIDIANLVEVYIQGWQLRLIHLVVRCQADRPADRPDFNELMLHVDWIETQPGYNNPDPFYKNYFATPPAKPGPADEPVPPSPPAGSSRVQAPLPGPRFAPQGGPQPVPVPANCPPPPAGASRPAITLRYNTSRTLTPTNPASMAIRARVDPRNASFGGVAKHPGAGDAVFWIPADGAEWYPGPVTCGLTDIVGEARMTYFYTTGTPTAQQILGRQASRDSNGEAFPYADSPAPLSAGGNAGVGRSAGGAKVPDAGRGGSAGRGNQNFARGGQVGKGAQNRGRGGVGRGNVNQGRGGAGRGNQNLGRGVQARRGNQNLRRGGWGGRGNANVGRGGE